VLDAYALTLAGLVLTAGSLADRLGRRRAFAAGLGMFSTASVLCALAPDATFLNLARALQGVEEGNGLASRGPTAKSANGQKRS
jgi:MFS family permease